MHPDLLNSRFGYVSISRASHQAIVFSDDIARFHSDPAADVSKTWNLVACCIERNKIKGDWDPATDAEGQPELEIKTLADLETHRDESIKRTRAYSRGKPAKWQALFEQARQNFERAVA